MGRRKQFCPQKTGEGQEAAGEGGPQSAAEGDNEKSDQIEEQAKSKAEVEEEEEEGETTAPQWWQFSPA